MTCEVEMLTQIQIARYKSLYDVTIDLEPLTVLIGPNASGKSNICEAIYFFSKLIQHIEEQPQRDGMSVTLGVLNQVVQDANLGKSGIRNKFWRGATSELRFGFDDKPRRKRFLFEVQVENEVQPKSESEMSVESPDSSNGHTEDTVLVNNAVETVKLDIIDELDKSGEVPKQLSDRFQAHSVSLTSKARIRVEHAGSEWMTEYGKKRYLIQKKNQALKVYRTNDVDSLAFPSEFIALPLKRELVSALDNVKIYDFSPYSISSESDASVSMSRTGEGVAYALGDILFESRERFAELESQLMTLIPTIGGIALERTAQNQYSLGLKDRFSKYVIPASDVSDGTLRILALLAALYETGAPDIICLEEPENGIHPWLLHKIIELLNRISQDGIGGHPVQFILTTHSIALLNYLKPEQIRAVELDEEGKTVVHKLPVDGQRFQKALDTFDGELGELWFTDMFGGNPR